MVRLENNGHALMATAINVLLVVGVVAGMAAAISPLVA